MALGFISSYWTIGISILTIPILLILIFAISLITYKYIEKPFRNISFKKKKKYFLILFSILFAQCILFILGFSGKRYLYLGNFNNLYNRKFNASNIGLNKCNLSKFEFEDVINDKFCNPTNNDTSKSKIIL